MSLYFIVDNMIFLLSVMSIGVHINVIQIDFLNDLGCKIPITLIAKVAL